MSARLGFYILSESWYGPVLLATAFSRGATDRINFGMYYGEGETCEWEGSLRWDGSAAGASNPELRLGPDSWPYFAPLASGFFAALANTDGTVQAVADALRSLGFEDITEREERG